MSDRPGFFELPPAWTSLVFGPLLGAAFIALATVALGESTAATVILDRGGVFPYPFTIQNLMHLLFFTGMVELFVRWRTAVRELGFRELSYLPEDDSTVLQARDLGPIRNRVAKAHDGENGFLPYLIDLSILQFHASRSVDQVVSILNSSLELIAHRVELRYSNLRYLAWVIPTVGFVGTVVGIALTLGAVDPANPDLADLTQRLAVAFNTTLVALVLSAILVFFLHVVQRLEERAVNDAGTYCLKNLINRLYVGAA
ncbi:MAG: MotA/TolQ/ExbB proton channel family protein [Gemmatimonadetes bacterium]|nr:MAG: MotA/TolQ/ExbB proton channel family protein [Gemmatimonadota bacterium]